MSSGKTKKQVNERTNLLRERLSKRYQSLNNRLDLVRNEQLGHAELIQLRDELQKPVQLSNTLAVTIGECDPGTGKYKRVLPKGYLTDLALVIKQIEQASKIRKDQVVTETELPVQPEVVQEQIETPVIVPVVPVVEVESGDAETEVENIEPQKVELVLTDLNKMNSNMFFLMEQYIAKPSSVLASKIKQLSHDLTNEAYEAAKIKFPKKVVIDELGRLKPNIGADEYSPILLEKIQAQAEQAFSFSTRMQQNQQFEEKFYETERAYLFKLSRDEKNVIHQLLRDMTSQIGSAALHPEGLIFAYDSYIERQSHGRFGYVEGKEASVYEHNTKLYLKAMALVQRGEDKAAEVLTAGCEQIKEIMASSDSDNEKYGKVRDVLVALQNDPTIQENRGNIKTVITNFLIMISVVGVIYLAATANSRGTFFYQPNTATKNQANDFEKVLDIPASQSMQGA